MSTLGDVEEAVERVETAVQEAAQSIERAIKENSWSSAFPVVWIGLLVYLVCAYVPGEVWHSKWRYELQYDVESSKIQYDKEPHDCEFLTAPLGNKHCHYERSVATLRWATSTTGLPIASFDDGKTWSTFTPDAGVRIPNNSTVEQVYVSWAKQQD
jgi:hypothetical protein